MEQFLAKTSTTEIPKRISDKAEKLSEAFMKTRSIHAHEGEGVWAEAGHSAEWIESKRIVKQKLTKKLIKKDVKMKQEWTKRENELLALALEAWTGQQAHYFFFEGVPTLKDKDDKVYDIGDHGEIGTFKDGKMVWNAGDSEEIFNENKKMNIASNQKPTRKTIRSMINRDGFASSKRKLVSEIKSFRD